MTDGLGLEGAYGETLSRIKGQGEEESKLGMATLMWISHSERPLEVNELCHALGVEIGSADLDGDNVPSIGTLLACCQGLVAVDKEASTIRLIHFTLQEYLEAHPELFDGPHATMAETCLSYLNSPQIKALSDSDSSYFPDTPFLEYSSLYWGVHAKRDLSSCAKQLALKLFDDDYSNHISTEILLNVREDYYLTCGSDESYLFTGLHCASFFGIVEVVAFLVEVEACDINQLDSKGATPLWWAARNGHGGVVEILLGRDDVEPDKPDNWDRTPLACVASNGHVGVAEILLRRGDVKSNQLMELCDESCITPLMWAAENGHVGVVEILLGRDDVEPDKPGDWGQTPLACAAENEHMGVVEILLRRGDVKPDQLMDLCEYSQTPFCWAAENGHVGVVEILLGRDDVEPDKPG